MNRTKSYFYSPKLYKMVQKSVDVGESWSRQRLNENFVESSLKLSNGDKSSFEFLGKVPRASLNQVDERKNSDLFK